uniref:Protein phosphatase n=1 Tax=Candidatus Kentrum sp. DK TaxID=2126562 RepID=A0A450SYJ7_9GAMM|nr:MAG: protein phosphatase [Candidatus Kentron sp. DK]
MRARTTMAPNDPRYNPMNDKINQNSTRDRRIVSACRTDTGRVRKVNEDAVFESPEQSFWVVADGMGGHAAGNYASGRVVDALRSLTWPGSLSQFLTDMEERLIEADRDIRDRARQEMDIIATTVVVLQIAQGHALFSWLGDSRLYRWRKGILDQLTRDHSDVEDMVEEGRISRERARTHPNAHVINRAIGVENFLALDMDIQPVENGDVYLLCTDGLNKELSDTEIANLLDKHREPEDAAQVLLDTALKKTASDNIALCVVNIPWMESSSMTHLCELRRQANDYYYHRMSLDEFRQQRTRLIDELTFGSVSTEQPTDGLSCCESGLAHSPQSSPVETTIVQKG